jgi:hypothetical protein
MGKLAVLMVFLLMITWVPAVALLVAEIAFSGTFAFLGQNPALLPAVTLLSFLEAGTVAAAMLALSSLSNNSRFVGILFAAVVFFTDAVYGVLRVVTGNTAISWISFGNDIQQVGDAIFRVPLRYATPWPASLGVLLALAVASAAVLERRIRGVEVVT